jgi:hypothetical protein
MNELQHLAKPKDGPAPRWFHIAVALSMIISAISALIATLHTGRTMTALVEQNAKLVRAGSTPILEFGHGNALDDGSSALEFNVRNVGTGVARIVWFELRLDGKPMQDMSAAIRTLDPNITSTLTFTSAPIASRSLAAGSDARILLWKKPSADTPDLLRAWSALDKARFQTVAVEACFCSVFEECWTSSLNGDVPKRVQACIAEGRASLRG